jgi:hypothetical protein
MAASADRDDVAVRSGCPAESRPIGHEPPAPVKQIPPAICPLHCSRNCMPQRRLADGGLLASAFRRPVAEARSEAMHRERQSHQFQELVHRVSVEWSAGTRTDEDEGALAR